MTHCDLHPSVLLVPLVPGSGELPTSCSRCVAEYEAWERLRETLWAAEHPEPWRFTRSPALR